MIFYAYEDNAVSVQCNIPGCEEMRTTYLDIPISCDDEEAILAHAVDLMEWNPEADGEHPSAQERRGSYNMVLPANRQWSGTFSGAIAVCGRHDN